MSTPAEYRQRARDCLQLARSATDVYAQVALAELADEFQAAAEELEQTRAGTSSTSSGRRESAAA